MNVAATITLTPGTVINRLISGHESASSSTAADLPIEEGHLAQRCGGRLDTVSFVMNWPPGPTDGRRRWSGRWGSTWTLTSSASGGIATVAVNVHRVEFRIGYDTRGS